MLSIVESSKAVAAVHVSAAVLHYQRNMRCMGLAQLSPGWASFIAFVGSAFEVILRCDLSFAVSVKSIFGTPSLLLRLLRLPKLSIDRDRGLPSSGRVGIVTVASVPVTSVMLLVKSSDDPK